MDNGNLPDGREADSACCLSAALPLGASVKPILRIPPFPGAKLRHLTPINGSPVDSAKAIAEAMRRLRVGGCFWGAQPRVPAGHILVRSTDLIGSARMMFADQPIVLWDWLGRAAPATDDRVTVISGDCDPWHVLDSASALVAGDPADELLDLAGISGVACYVGAGNELVNAEHRDLRAALTAGAFEDPFTGEPMTVLAAVELCGFWRQLIDSNRDLGGGLGFAFWKRSQVGPLLWGGSGQFPFTNSADDVKDGSAIAVWRAKAPAEAIAAFERRGASLVEVEDGFLRSRGLGADCIPPLSITVDRRGAYFDPSRPSDLEELLEHGDFSANLIARAAELRRLVVESGLGKYERGGGALERPAGSRRHILVPGQVEDDRAVQLGGCGLVSNLELLKMVREDAPEAFILYKPHPDVVAGHRRGAIPDRHSLQYADRLVGDVPIASLIDMVDEVHVNTSLAGFEALLRGKTVTAHGVPFYSGWGLTRDLGPVPQRRTAKRSVDELVAATLLLYPRYLDPETGLPCPAEILVRRLAAMEENSAGLLVGFRRLQGKFMRRLRSLVQ
jgi:capsular polysaccharide export protein